MLIHPLSLAPITPLTRSPLAMGGMLRHPLVQGALNGLNTPNILPQPTYQTPAQVVTGFTNFLTGSGFLGAAPQ